MVIKSGSSLVDSIRRIPGVSRLKDTVEGVVCTCPYHRDTRPSFSISLKKGVFCCYSAKCGKAGPLSKLFVDFYGMGIVEAGDYVRSHIATYEKSKASLMFNDWPAWSRRSPSSVDQHKQLDAVNSDILGMYQNKYPKYMESRGFSQDLCRDFQVRWNSLASKVVIPVRNRYGEFVGVTQRATRMDDPVRYMHSYPRGSVLFQNNGHTRMVVSCNGKATSSNLLMFVVESPMSVMRIVDIVGGDGCGGVTGASVVAFSTLGSRVTKWQIDEIVSIASDLSAKVVLAFDMDSDGTSVARKCYRYLLPRCDVSVVRWDCKYGKDPDDVFVKSGGDAFASIINRDFEISGFDWRL